MLVKGATGKTSQFATLYLRWLTWGYWDMVYPSSLWSEVEELYSSSLTHSMMKSSNGNIFRVTGPLCGEFTGPGDFPTQRPVTRSFDVFVDLHLNKRLSKLPWGWWFETPSWSLWRHCNVYRYILVSPLQLKVAELCLTSRMHCYRNIQLPYDYRQGCCPI